VTTVRLPHNGWRARHYQLPLWKYLCRGGKRAVAIWHRRAGKDDVALHYACISAVERPSNLAHCLPLFNQGRRSIWDAVNPHSGKRRIDEAFPHALRAYTREHDMVLGIHAKGGGISTWSVIGSDTYNSSLVGSSLAGITFSEYSLSNPSAWGFARPMLEENNGWALFITTPRGRNHAYQLYNHQ
jgi:hypothetical protein